MKTAIISAIVIAFTAQSAFASKKPEVSKAIERAVRYEPGTLPIAKDHSEFVKMSLTIDKNDGITVIEVNASNEEIKSHVLEKVAELKFEDMEAMEDTLYYNIVFKKL